MNFLKIAWRDISAIFKNRFIRVSVVAIIIVPLLYSLLYLYAFWDPYSKLSDMPVAVVNMDKGGTKDGKDVNYGKDVVDKLKDNNKVGWRFVDYNDAKSGVEGKKYYAMFVIPDDFTKNTLTVEQKDLIQPKIYFTSNDKRNFLAAQINGKVVVELKAEITKSMAKESYKVLFDNLNDIKDKMQLAADGSKKISDGNSELAGKIPEMKDGVGQLANGASQLKDGLASLSGNVPALKDGVGQLSDGAGQLSDGVNTKDVDESHKPKGLILGLDSLFSGVQQLDNGLNTTAVDANGKPLGLKTGATALVGGVQQLNNGLTTTSVDKNGKPLGLKVGANALLSGVQTLNIGLNTTAVDANGNPLGLKVGANALLSGVQTLNTGLNTTAVDANGNPLGLKVGANALLSGVQQLNNGLTTTAVDANGNPLGLKAGANALLSGIDTLNKSINSATGLKAGVNGLYNAVTYVDQTNPMDPSKNGIAQALKLAQAALKGGNAAQAQAIIDGLVQQTSTNSADQTKPTFLDVVTGVNAGVNTLANKVNTELLPGAQGVYGGVDTIATKVSGQLLPGVRGVSGGVDTIAAKVSNELLPGTQGVYGGVDTIATKVNNELLPGTQGVSGGVDTLANAVSTQLLPGAQGVYGGIDTVASNVDSQLLSGVDGLRTGAKKLGNGLIELNNGVKTLNNNVPALADGANKLYDGSVQLNDGLSTLNGKMPDLLDGTTKLKDGSKELSDKLADGSKELDGKLLNDSDTMSEFLSHPVDINQKAINEVKTYGAGFAPYFISLSLYVGVMLMFFVITEEVDEDIKASSASLVLGKFVSYGIIGIIQAVLASAIVVALGLRPANMTLYFLFNVFSSLVFIAIVQSLVFLLGQAGRLLSIVLLILQLTACAGTFPLEVVPKFFKVLNPFMPFTYTVEALRELISGVDYSVVAKDATILGAVMVTFVIISVLMKGHADKVKEAIQAKKEIVA